MLPAAVQPPGSAGCGSTSGHGVGSFAYQVARQRHRPGLPARHDLQRPARAQRGTGPPSTRRRRSPSCCTWACACEDVIRATTATPAAAVRREARIGALAAGREADLSVFELREGAWPLPDAAGATEIVERLLVPRLVIRAGQARELAAPADPGRRLRPRRRRGRPVTSGRHRRHRDHTGGPARADVLIDGGTIAAIVASRAIARPRLRRPGRAAAGRSGLLRAARRASTRTATSCRGVRPATAAAARGGTTTVLSFTGPAAGERDLDALLRNRGELERGGAVTDIGLHAAIYDPEHISHDDLAAVKRAGAAPSRSSSPIPSSGSCAPPGGCTS